MEGTLIDYALSSYPLDIESITIKDRLSLVLSKRPKAKIFSLNYKLIGYTDDLRSERGKAFSFRINHSKR